MKNDLQGHKHSNDVTPSGLHWKSLWILLVVGVLAHYALIVGSALGGVRVTACLTIWQYDPASQSLIQMDFFQQMSFILLGHTEPSQGLQLWLPSWPCVVSSAITNTLAELESKLNALLGPPLMLQCYHKMVNILTTASRHLLLIHPDG